MQDNHLNPWDENAQCRIDELESRFDKTYWEVLVPLFRKEVTKTGNNIKIIDIGCGLGFLTNEIASNVQGVTGIDTSTKSIEYAKSRFIKNNLEFFNISIIDFQKKYYNAHFDICIANMVFHNIPDLDDNLNAISKLLKRNGVLIFSIPHPAFWYNSRKFQKSEFYEYSEEKEFIVPFKIRNRAEHPCPISYWHRSIKRYSDLLTKNNFIINRQDEPYLDLDLPGNDKVTDILYYICQQK